MFEYLTTVNFTTVPIKKKTFTFVNKKVISNLALSFINHLFLARGFIIKKFCKIFIDLK